MNAKERASLPIIDVHAPRIGRDCDGCSLCCTVMGVAELDKVQHVRCHHETSRNRCSIYADRPKGCRDFQCLWREGVLPRALHPNRVHAVVHWSRRDNMMIIQMDVREGVDEKAHKRGALWTHIQLWAKSFPFIVRSGETSYVYGPKKEQNDQIASEIESYL